MYLEGFEESKLVDTRLCLLVAGPRGVGAVAGAGRVLFREAMGDGLGAMGTGVALVTGFLGFDTAAPVFTIGAD